MLSDRELFKHMVRPYIGIAHVVTVFLIATLVI